MQFFFFFFLILILIFFNQPMVAFDEALLETGKSMCAYSGLCVCTYKQTCYKPYIIGKKSSMITIKNKK
jgi:hypothetical protein